MVPVVWVAALAVLWAASVLCVDSRAAESWQTGPGYRFRALEVPAGPPAGFHLLGLAETGITFTNVLPEARYLTNQILPNGSGVTAGDVDGDGWCDLFFCGLGGSSRFYRNRGQWRFEDATAGAGLACPELDATGGVFADVDGDGDLDLIVNSIGGGTQVFLNDGRGRFQRSPVVLNPQRGGTSLALGDVRGNGSLDLYVGNYRASALIDAPGTRFNVRVVDGQPVVASVNGRPLSDPEWTNRFRFKFEVAEGGRMKFGHEELGEPDTLLFNDGHGRFEPVSWTGGQFLDEDGQPLKEPPFDWCLSVLLRDFNGDGWPDLYVCNDFNTPDRFWLNDGHGRFRAAPRWALRESSLAAMAIDAGDLDRDGHDDFLVLDMLSRDHRRRLVQRNMLRAEMAAASRSEGRPQYPRNTLFMNRGDGTYAEIAQYAGLEASEWSWNPLFLDVDLDGFEDVLIPNGFVRDNMNVDAQHRMNQAREGSRLSPREQLLLRRFFPRLDTENLAFHNRGQWRFEEVGRSWGFHANTISQGACLADLDNDGDLDVVLNNLNDAAGIYRNEGTAPRLAVRLKGLPPNTRGIGARITLVGGAVTQSQEMVCGGRYLSGDESLRVFAVGGSTQRLSLRVVWRSGRQSRVEDARTNSLYEIDEAGARSVPTAPRVPPSPCFEDVSERLGHRHEDREFNDFERQPLLPKRLSQLGPGVCWWDVDGDGREDLVIGSGAGGALACFRNDGDGRFQRLDEAPWNLPATRDQTALAAWKPGEVLAATAHYEEGQASGPAVQSYARGVAAPTDTLAAWNSSVGPLALADYDGDGSVDLFVGGRVEPGRYPTAATSRLYRQRAGQWVLDEANSGPLAQAAMVGGAVWSDVDGDGWPDLVLACEWGPVRVFRNAQGRLREVTEELGLAAYGGWWNGVAAGDFDGDGRMDLVAANWGRNTKYESHRQRPLRLYYGDFNQDRAVNFLEAYFEPGSNRYVPHRMLDVVSRSLPFLAERFQRHQDWAEAGIDEILRDRPTRMLEAPCLESTLFLNRGSRFEARALPLEAQLAPAFAVCVADYDGDGNEDVFLSQNFFAVDGDTSRYDAGRGLWLRGDGRGGFASVPGQESGVRVYGEQRGAAVADFDGDGRVDLAVTQNRAETRLFHNVRGRPGLRVRLVGPPGNPAGLGAVLRLRSGERWGPAREVHGGAGYGSQDGAVQVLTMPQPPTQLWVRWPGGRIATTDVPSGARQIVVDADGHLK